MKTAMIIITRKIMLTLGLALAPLLYTGAQESTADLNLSLAEAVDHALAYNKSLKNARLEVEQARHTIWESIAQGLPQVEGAVEYQTFFNYELEFSFGMGGDVSFTEEQLMEALNNTLSQPQFQEITPREILAHQAGNYYDAQLQSMLPPSTILMSDQSTARLQVSQLIFSGQYLVGIQTARLARQISEQNLEFSELNIKESVINAYYLVLITEESLAILRQNLENMEETLGQTETMYRTGMAEKTDVDQIRITASQLENSIRSLERNLELNYNMLRFQLGLEAGDPLQLTDDLESLFAGMEPETALVTPFNMDHNISYQIMEKQEEINKKLVSLEQW
ncbi:MAG: TolC family protein, partial [Bacteroidetes bacterium]